MVQLILNFALFLVCCIFVYLWGKTRERLIDTEAMLKRAGTKLDTINKELKKTNTELDKKNEALMDATIDNNDLRGAVELLNELLQNEAGGGEMPN